MTGDEGKNDAPAQDMNQDTVSAACRSHDPTRCRIVVVQPGTRGYPRRTPGRRPATEHGPRITSPHRHLLHRDPLNTCDSVSHAQ
jgi:hypothetical protein